MRFLLLLVSLCLCAPAHARAAIDGSRGSQSTGTLKISLTIVPEVRVSGLQDLQLMPAPSQGLTATSPVCVALRGAGGYQLQASSSAPGQRFVLGSGDREAPYQVYFQTPQGHYALQPNVPLTGLTAHRHQTADCAANGPHGQLQILLSEAARQSLGAGVYASTLSLTVAPE